MANSVEVVGEVYIYFLKSEHIKDNMFTGQLQFVFSPFSKKIMWYLSKTLNDSPPNHQPKPE